jgi:hypothetical protein
MDSKLSTMFGFKDQLNPFTSFNTFQNKLSVHAPPKPIKKVRMAWTQKTFSGDNTPHDNASQRWLNKSLVQLASLGYHNPF